VFEIVEIEFKLILTSSDGSRIALELCPPRKARADMVTVGVKRDSFFQLFNNHNLLRSWAHERKVSFDEIPSLRDFI